MRAYFERHKITARTWAFFLDGRYQQLSGLLRVVDVKKCDPGCPGPDRIANLSRGDVGAGKGFVRLSLRRSILIMKKGVLTVALIASWLCRFWPPDDREALVRHANCAML